MHRSRQNLVKSDDDMVIDVLRLDDYFNKLNQKKEQASKKFHCYYWRYGQVGSLLSRNQIGRGKFKCVPNWTDHPRGEPQALHTDRGILGKEVPRILLWQRLHPQRQRQQGMFRFRVGTTTGITQNHQVRQRCTEASVHNFGKKKTGF